MEVIKSLVNNIELNNIETVDQLYNLVSEVIVTEKLDYIQTKHLVTELYSKWNKLKLN